MNRPNTASIKTQIIAFQENIRKVKLSQFLFGSLDFRLSLINRIKPKWI